MSVSFEAIAKLLDANPATYRAFGVYWWTLKRLMRESGMRRWYLGPTDDLPCRMRIRREIGTDPATLLAAAAHHYRTKALHGEAFDGGSRYPGDDDDPYELVDEDFGPAAGSTA